MPGISRENLRIQCFFVEHEVDPTAACHIEGVKFLRPPSRRRP
jgi:hypothetical protein